MTKLTVAEVHSEHDRREMVMFPWKVYRGDKNWVPPVIKERDLLLDPRRNPFFRQADVTLLQARRDDRLVGTIAPFVDHGFNAVLNKRIGFFGFFEVLEDEEAAHALLGAARDWARARGMTALRGPINFHRDRDRGILVEGADCPPPLLCGHTPPYYQDFVERFGMVKFADDLARRMFIPDILEPDGSLPPRVVRLKKVAERRAHLSIRRANLADWDNEVQRVREIYDSTIGQLPDHVPWTDEDLTAFAAKLRPFVDPDLILFGEVEGKLVGVVLAFPDLNQVLIHMDGRLDGWRKLLAWWHMRRIDVVSFKVGGVIEKYQGLGLEALFLLELAQGALARGYRWVDMSLQAEDNEKLTTLMSHFKVEDYKRYRLYQMPL